MYRPTFRSIAVAAGFLGISMIVAGTASAMADSPADAPFASAVELRQEDPSSITPAVEAGGEASATVADVPAPIEVGSAAIECSDDGVCDGSRPPSPTRDTQSESRGDARARPATPACDWPAAPTRPSASTDVAEWKRDFHQWVDEWHAMARECGGDAHAWAEAIDRDGWQDLDGAWWDEWKRGSTHDWQGHDDKREQHREGDSGWGGAERERTGTDDGAGTDTSTPEKDWKSTRNQWRDADDHRESGR